MEKQKERARGAWKGSGEEAVAECYLKAASSGILSEFAVMKALSGLNQRLRLFSSMETSERAAEGQKAILF